MTGLIESSVDKEKRRRNTTGCWGVFLCRFQYARLNRQVGCLAILVLSLPVAQSARAAQRINQEGRILGPAPVVTTPTLFNTAGADTIVSAMQVFPVTSAWNEDVSKQP